MMRVQWKYDLLFTFRLKHELPLNQSLQIIPTPLCRKMLSQVGMFFKPVPDGGNIIVEKRVLSAGSEEPLRSIQSPRAFTFIIKLSNSDILSLTKPYDQTFPEEFLGRSKILYLDNLDSSNNIDSNLSAPTTIPDSTMVWSSMPLAINNSVTLDDFASLAPNEFTFLADITNPSQVQVDPLSPTGATNASVDIEVSGQLVNLKLGQSAFRISQSGGTPSSELVFADSELLTSRAYGIVQIFKDQSIDYNRTIRYDINFEKI